MKNRLRWRKQMALWLSVSFSIKVFTLFDGSVGQPSSRRSDGDGTPCPLHWQSHSLLANTPWASETKKGRTLKFSSCHCSPASTDLICIFSSSSWLLLVSHRHGNGPLLNFNHSLKRMQFQICSPLMQMKRQKRRSRNKKEEMNACAFAEWDKVICWVPRDRIHRHFCLTTTVNFWSLLSVTLCLLFIHSFTLKAFSVGSFSGKI